MKYLNYYNSLYENVSSLTSYNNWSIDYNDENHDLNIRLIQRSNIRDTNIFSKLVEKIINKSIESNLDGEYSFVFPQFNFLQVIANIDNNNKDIFIITFLSRTMETKNINDKIIMNKIHNINEELKNIIYDDSIDFLKSMIFWDGDKWDISSKIEFIYNKRYGKKIPKDIFNIFLKIPNIFNTDKKYKNISSKEEVSLAIDDILNSQENQNGFELISTFEKYFS